MQTEKKSGPGVKTIGLMMAITLAGKLLGVLRDRMQSISFGADTAEAIAFMQASSLPRNFLDIMFASVFSASFIPVFNAYLETKGKRAAFDLAALFVSFTLTLTVAFTLLCILFAPQLYAVFQDGSALSSETRTLAVTLLRLMFPLMVLSGLAFSFTGVLQSMGEFNLPAAMSVVSNGIILVYYFFFIEKFGVYGLCAAFLLGWAAQFLIQLPFLIKHQFKFRFKLNLKDPGLRQVAALALPVMVSGWVGPVNLLVNAKAAVNLYGGKYGVVSLNFAYNLYAIISGVLVLSVANAVFPQLSKQTAVGDREGFTHNLLGTLRGLLFFLLPMSFGLIAVSRPLVALVYQGGQFDDFAVQTTAEALAYFSVGIVGYGLQIVLSRACYALRDGRLAMVSSLAAMVVNAGASFALAPRMGVAGPALASSVSISISAFILWVALCKRGWLAGARGMRVDVLKMAAVSVLMFAGVVFVREALPFPGNLWGRALAAGVPAALGGMLYFGGCLLFKLDEAQKIVLSFKKVLVRV